ncbi:MAG: DUF389 domain-containing protein [Cloacibacterium sp.]|nr:DUF389 domain-containing protein [Cloacibacterium sp.]
MSNFLFEYINLHRGEEDKQKTLADVKNNISFKGANLWILACAILVASVGLNVNSTAVIIGAMLISPLMGPIVGSGFALGIYDFDLLKKSLKNLAVATLVSLLVSALYFWLSPFKQAQSELLARTSPNIYDVLIAFFGGLVGVIAMTRVEKGNPIPGVAIATALMPPLCTAGYGLATGNFKFFLGALFLYTINCVFIGIATFIIVKYLKYPHAIQVDEKHQKQVQYGITALTILILLPSIYFAYALFHEQKFKQLTDDFIQKEFVDKGYTVVYKKTNFNNINNTLELVFLTKIHTKKEEEELNEKLRSYGLKNTQLIIKKNTLENTDSDTINELNVKDRKIAELEARNNTNAFNSKQLLQEIAVLFPKIKKISMSRQNLVSTDAKEEEVTVFLYQSTGNLTSDEIATINLWLQKKFSVNNVKLIALNETK